jgi:polysaccharide biosynthesis/export protein
MRCGNRSTAGLVAVLVLAVLVLLPTAYGKEYQIGNDDVLEITFWQDVRLNTTVRVGQDGKITLDVVGQIDAAGKTTAELQDEIVRSMSRLKKDISQAVVRVTIFNYNYVFVNGQVRTPGKRTFEEIPDLWTVINESGGITDIGDLSRVTIIRGGDQAGKVEVVNVSRALSEGSVDKLPKLRRGDTIDIPPSPGNISTAGVTQQTELKSLIYVIGAVARPGPVAFQDNTDITDVLSLAGGPTAAADLRKVKILTKDGAYAQSYQVDLERYSASGKPARYVLRKEDTFIVPERHEGFFGTGLNVGTVAAVVGVVTSVYLLVDRLNQNNNNNSSSLSTR